MGAEKACTRCGKVFSAEFFHKDKRSSDGRRTQCKECVSALSKEASLRPPVVAPGVTEKSCSRCKRLGRESVHPINDFGIARRRKDGRNSWCKKCCAESSSSWQKTKEGRLKHIEAVKRYNKKKRYRRSEVDTGVL